VLIRSSSSFALVLVAVALAGCPPPVNKVPDAGTANDESCHVDRNFAARDPTTADPITANTPVQGYLCPQRDDDGYKIHVDNPGSILVVSLSMPTALTNVHPGYTISELSADGKTQTAVVPIQGDPNHSQGHATNFTEANRVNDGPADYIVDVSDVEGLDNGFDDINEYTLTVNVVADPDKNEPNDLPAQATPITSGTPINGQIATTGDQDWYSIAVTGATQQIVDATITVPADSGVNHVATLFAHDAQTILQTVALAADPTDATKDTARIRIAVTVSQASAGTLLLQIEDDPNNPGTLGAQLDPAKGQYTINLNVIPDPDANEGAEGNQDTAHATPVAASSSGTSVTASIASLADRDVYEVTPPAGTSRNTPQVLEVDVTFDSGITIGPDFQPQVRVVAANPEKQVKACPASGPSTAPTAECTECYNGPSGNSCAEDMLQRFVKTGTFKVAYPLRSTEPVFIEINEFSDHAFEDNGLGYTMVVKVLPDPDPGEHGDDFIVQNLEFAGFANNVDLDSQYNNSVPDRARVVTLGYNPVCDATSNADPTITTCLHTKPVSNPVGFGFPADELDCATVPSKSVTLTGRLTYDGDRDYFLLPDFPSPTTYMNMDIQYSISQATPVELTVFVHGSGGRGDLAGSFLGDAQQVGSCTEQQGGQNACQPGSICVDQQCWTDTDNNPAVSGDFGGASDPGGNCVEAGPTKAENGPLVVEVVDNGLNDFDLNMVYSITLNITCGCPAQCDSSQDYCQNGP
jgi:hypothetical protein